MPVFINEMIAEVTPPVVPPATQQPAQATMPLSPPEYELVKMLNRMNERQVRLQFD